MYTINRIDSNPNFEGLGNEIRQLLIDNLKMHKENYVTFDCVRHLVNESLTVDKEIDILLSEVMAPATDLFPNSFVILIINENSEQSKIVGIASCNYVEADRSANVRNFLKSENLAGSIEWDLESDWISSRTAFMNEQNISSWNEHYKSSGCPRVTRVRDNLSAYDGLNTITITDTTYPHENHENYRLMFESFPTPVIVSHVPL